VTWRWSPLATPNQQAASDAIVRSRWGTRLQLRAWRCALAERAGGVGWRSGLAEWAGGATWRSDLAERLGGPGWRTGLADRVGGVSWRSELADQLGGASWRSELAERVGGAGWRSGLAEWAGGVGWRSGLAEWAGGVGWRSDLAVVPACDAEPTSGFRCDCQESVRDSTATSCLAVCVGGASWRSGLAEWAGGVGWRSGLAERVGGPTWRSELAEWAGGVGVGGVGVGGVGWRSDLAVLPLATPNQQTVSDAIVRSRCGTRLQPRAWRCALAERVGGPGWRSDSAVSVGGVGVGGVGVGGVDWRSGLAEWIGGVDWRSGLAELPGLVADPLWVRVLGAGPCWGVGAECFGMSPPVRPRGPNCGGRCLVAHSAARAPPAHQPTHKNSSPIRDESPHSTAVGCSEQNSPQLSTFRLRLARSTGSRGNHLDLATIPPSGSPGGVLAATTGGARRHALVCHLGPATPLASYSSS